MKKILFNLLIIIIICCSVIVLNSCNKNKHTHDYGEWNIVTPATCTSNGLREKKCECGEIVSETIPLLGHNYISGVCTDCGELE